MAAVADPRGNPLLVWAKASLRSAFGQVGLEIRRKRKPGPPPPLYDDPLEALYLVTQLGQPAAFRCPVEAIVNLQAFGLARDAWHPFVAATRELELRGEAAAEAVLERFYAVFRPRSAAEAYPGFRNAPPSYADLPPQLFYLPPWGPWPVEQAKTHIKTFIEADNREHGRGDLTIEAGFTTLGPVSPDKRKLELRRLASLHAAMKQAGFDRLRGDCQFALVRRGRDLRGLPGPGHHRASVMAALGAEWVPGQVYTCVNVADVDYWPQVRCGLWSRRQALAYIDYLFEFDSAEWARGQAVALGS